MADKNRNLIPWKPGQSGNPKGRPKKPVDLTALLKQALEGTKLLGQDTPDGSTVAEMFVQTQIAAAMKGNAAIAKEIWERIAGKAKEEGVGEPANASPMNPEVADAMMKAGLKAAGEDIGPED